MAVITTKRNLATTERCRRRRLTATSIAVALGVSLGVAVTASETGPADAAILARERFHPQAGPHGALTVIGDSVLLGSVINSPTVGDRLVEYGWGPVRVRGGAAYSTGHFPVTTEARTSHWIQRWRAEGWDAPNLLINLGANDSGFCDVDLQCARDAIMHLVGVIGPGHRIWWPQVTRHPVLQRQADNWNLALRQIAAERADFFTWDWPQAMATGGFVSGDNTHLSPDGYRTRSLLLARELTADLASAERTGGPATLPRAVGGTTELVPVGPVRALDTRDDPPGRVTGGTAIEVDVSSLVPSDSTAVAAYVSATETGADGFLTAYECASGRPEASSANYLAGETRGAVAVVPISVDGRFCLFTLADAHLLVDVQAAFVPAGSGDPGGSGEPAAPDVSPLRFDPLPAPRRLLDTRVTGRAQIHEIAVPDGAAAVSVSVTAVLSDDPGFVVAYPCDDDPPLVATVNHFPDEVISGAAFVPVSASGSICVWSLAPVDITVDLTGTFSPTGDLVFQPATPTRMLDTRVGIGGWTPLHGGGQTIDVVVAPPTAAAVTGTLTIVQPIRNGFLQASGCTATTDTANVTALADTVLANSVTTGLGGDGTLCVTARAATASLFDTTGWWLPAD